MSTRASSGKPSTLRDGHELNHRTTEPRRLDGVGKDWLRPGACSWRAQDTPDTRSTADPWRSWNAETATNRERYVFMSESGRLGLECGGRHCTLGDASGLSTKCLTNSMAAEGCCCTTPSSKSGRQVRRASFLSPSIEYAPHRTVLCFTDHGNDSTLESPRHLLSPVEDEDDEETCSKRDGPAMHTRLGSASRVRVVASKSSGPSKRYRNGGMRIRDSKRSVTRPIHPSLTLWSSQGSTPYRPEVRFSSQDGPCQVLYSEHVLDTSPVSRRVLPSRAAAKRRSPCRLLNDGTYRFLKSYRRQITARSTRRPLASNDAVWKRLVNRELGALASYHFRKQTTRERFRSMHLCHEYDANHFNKEFSLPFLRRRAKIVEIVASGDVVFCLGSNGICSAFSRVTCRRLCCLNTASDEIIRSLFLNKVNDSIITVSVRDEDRFSSLRCRSTPP